MLLSEFNLNWNFFALFSVFAVVRFMIFFAFPFGLFSHDEHCETNEKKDSEIFRMSSSSYT